MAGTELSEWPHVFRDGSGPVLLMLHGTGGNEQEIAELAAELDTTAAVLSPRGRVSEGGANRWFRRLGEGIFDVDDLIDRAAELAGFIESAREEYPISDRPITAVGFSNGANMALAMAFLHPQVIQSVVAFSGMYPLAERDAPHQLDGSRVLLLNGSDDAMAPQRSVDRLEAQLDARAATVERVTRAGGHGITREELDTAKRWLREQG